ncbi:hypothetical protein CJP74_05735 [Psittacicella melopsittaci]|uniref:Uncharacterized protein n=1 Tax=Psittacicella melopsittaci TaxID=2028576 RepID=A0A3A1Y3J8_9GAMM|nr:hypothetical protein [Psittacicella melopsittaci]RIY32000.1 hypothetical protein CJP74_05735 [Psittacicella melopsittaci]
MYNAHLLDHKVLLNPVREEAIYANPIQNRYEKLTGAYLGIAIATNIEQQIRYTVNTLTDLDLSFSEILSQLEDKQVTELNVNSFFELEKEHIYLVSNFFEDLDSIAKSLNIIKHPSDKVSQESLEFLDELLATYIDTISLFNTGFDYYSQKQDTDDFLCLQIKSIVDIYYTLVASIDAYLGGKLEDLVLMAQETSLFNIYYQRNFIEAAKQIHLSGDEFAHLPLVDIEITRQWDVYRLIQNVINGKLTFKIALEKVQKIQEKSLQAYNKAFNQEFA